jgi:molybdopterin/thiamine biosynthesis adenylyltransferase
MDETLETQIHHIAEAEGELRVLRLEHVQALAEEFGLPKREVELAALEAEVLPRRYLRSFGTVGLEGQARLLRSTVAVVGLGGLGGNVTEGLARMGVGRLVLIDGDVFVDHNLNRQILSAEENLGRSKAEVARERVARVNSAVEVIAHALEARPENLPQLLEGADVVVDGLDRLPPRFMLQEAAQALGIPMVHGAIAGYLGQVMTIFPGDPGLQALYGGGPLPERGVEAQQGTPAGTPMMVAGWQIQEVVKLLLGQGEPLRHRLLFIDAESGWFDVVRLN